MVFIWECLATRRTAWDRQEWNKVVSINNWFLWPESKRSVYKYDSTNVAIFLVFILINLMAFDLQMRTDKQCSCCSRRSLLFILRALVLIYSNSISLFLCFMFNKCSKNIDNFPCSFGLFILYKNGCCADALFYAYLEKCQFRIFLD